MEGKTMEIPSSKAVSTKLCRIAQLAGEDRARVLTSLCHHIDKEFLREAYRLTRKDGAVGVDGQRGEDFARNLEANLEDLLSGFKTGRYRAPSVRRVHIPKGDGRKTRPLGIPTFADKVLQRAVTMVLNAVYEQDFLNCSYGFRPGRSAHEALDALREGLREMGGGWVLDVDVQAFFDNLDHGKLREILDQRVRDGVVRRMIDKWLKAGILEDGELRRPHGGTPQGGVVSPILANVYLHEVLDTWFEDEVRPRLRGRAFLIRYADDFIMAFSCEEDAHRVLEVLPKRFARYGLTVHPEKTRLVAFRPPRPTQRDDEDQDRKAPPPGTFDLLGFTHYWARSRRGYWVIKRKTAKDRLNRALRTVEQWCHRNYHRPIAEQRATLVRKLTGHYNYYGITGNSPALGSFLWHVERIWKRWLGRRSQRGYMSWERFKQLVQRYPLPLPRIRAASVT
jgi:group II intron reverse transcriptase/maturase